MKHKNFSRTVEILLCTVIFFFVFLSCSGADPVIYKLDWTLQVNVDPNILDKSVESLILHVLADDEDGFEELYELYVIHNDSELYWRITSEEWSEFTDNEKKWIGVNALKTEDEMYLPRGEYRVLLRDLSGYETEKKFTLRKTAAQYTHASLPSIGVDNEGTYTPYFKSTTSTEKEQEIPFGFLQIMHPKDAQITINGQTKDISSLLGVNGAFYKIFDGSGIAFDSEDVVRFSVYLYYRQTDTMMFRIGPYDILLNK